MNGRLYDPVLRSFLMPDNFIQQPENTQNYNRYAYVLNNPLMYTDPSGEVINFLVAVAIGAAVAATTYTLTALLADVPFSVGGLLKSTFIGAASAAVTFGIGSASTALFTNFYSQAAFQAVAHGTFQGTMTAISGGKFWSGFAAGALSSIASSAWGGGTTKTEGFSAENNWAYGAKTIHHAGLGAGTGTAGMIAFGTIVGGGSAMLTGGNFWQGAATGLVVSGLNHAAHQMDSEDGLGDGDPKPKIKPIPKKLQAKIDRLRAGFEFMEEYGGYTEIAGLVLAPFTEGASLGVTGVGMVFTGVGTTGSTILDLFEYKYTNDPAKLISARNRLIKYGLTLGTGKALEKLTFNFTDKLITKFLDVVIDKGIYTPVLPTVKPK